MRRPLGCFTFSALIAAVLVTLVVLAAAVATGNGIFSPGQLSGVTHGSPVGGVTSHADLGARCDACHAAAGSSDRMGYRCLACHTRVGDDIASKGGLHGRLLATTTNCRDCHTDHRGAEVSPTLADPRVFPHEQTGYALGAHPLRGQGGSFGCRDCHGALLGAFSVSTCIACHRALDPPAMALHQDAFGTLCLNCHDGVDTYGKAYDHASYPLLGGHAGASCVACHRGATTPAALRATATECAACHAAKDVHQGRLGASCSSCHTTSAWLPATFDHSKAAYPLTGAHLAVACAKCHVGGVYKGTPTTCSACHTKPTSHSAAYGSTCSSCHTTSAWLPATFDHSKAAYPLTGAHLAVACAKCHVGGVYKGTPTTCSACHTKPTSHSAAYGSTCSSCHTTSAWLPATFDHSKAAYPLTGAHLAVACAKCHVGGVYKGTPTTCSACHTKPTSHSAAYGSTCSSCHTTSAWLPATFDHSKAAYPLTGAHLAVACAKCHVGGVYKGTPTTCSACHTKPTSHSAAYGSTCSSCHTTSAWLPATFDHSKAAYPLTGAHLAVACAKCHVGGVYKGTPTTCSACHTKPTSHSAAYGSTCSSCHTTSAWLPATFDHSKAAYPLTGAHLAVACAKCHVGGVYKGTPTTCSACHTKPTSHSAAYGSTCSSCHTTSAWLPATFDHSKAAYPLTGAHLAVACAKCHVGGVYKGTPTTCSACHTKPTSHSAAYGSTCSSCHTTSAWLPATFDHSKAAYPLTGAHLAVACAKCHVGGVYKGTPTTCSACHTKPTSHSAAYGSTCSSCHTTSAWLPATFDHSKAAYPLTGAHLAVACAKCHVGGVYKGTPTTCSACHTKPTSHSAAYGSTCSSCHTTSAWLPATYNGPHTFPMSHGGAGGVCSTCHPSTLASYTCRQCHSDSSMSSRHSGVSGFSLTTCARCHATGRGGD